MSMPRMTGDQLAGELLNIRPDIPVIICTGLSERISSAKIKDLGISDFLLKPVMMADLAFSIRKALDDSKKVG
jgi:FixJ family two-component response regulator